jgi:hypothetical protein
VPGPVLSIRAQAASHARSVRHNPEVDELGRLTVSRTLEEDIGQRQVIVYVDGRRIGALRAGETLTREIRPGSYTLKAHNTLFGKTAEFTVSAGEDVRFETANVAGFGSFLVLVLGAGPLYVALRRAEPS